MLATMCESEALRLRKKCQQRHFVFIGGGESLNVSLWKDEATVATCGAPSDVPSIDESHRHIRVESHEVVGQRTPVSARFTRVSAVAGATHPAIPAPTMHTSLECRCVRGALARGM